MIRLGLLTTDFSLDDSRVIFFRADQFYGQLHDDLLQLKPARLSYASYLQRAAAWIADVAWVIGGQRLISAIPWERWSVTAPGPAPGDKGRDRVISRWAHT